MYCNNCGKSFLGNEKYCTNCGRPRVDDNVGNQTTGHTDFPQTSNIPMANALNKSGDTFAIIGFIFSIISILYVCSLFVGLLYSAISIGFVVASNKNGTKRFGFNVASIVISIVSIIACIAYSIYFLALYIHF